MERYPEEKFTPLSIHPRANLYKVFDEQSAEVEVCQFIQKTVEITKPGYVVETGSHTGILSSFICEAIAANGHGEIDTIEIDGALHQAATQRLAKYAFANVIHGSSLDFTPRRHIDMLVVDSQFELSMQEIIKYSPYLDENSIIYCRYTSPLSNPVMRTILENAKKEMLIKEVNFFDTPTGLSQLCLCVQNTRFFCLNLPKATERREYSIKEFKKAGISVDFVRAFDTRYNNIKHVQDWYQIGHLGCCLSHINIIEEIGRYNYTGVVFEDDVMLAEDFKNRFNTVMSGLPHDWEIAYIGWWPHYGDYTALQTIKVNAYWQKITRGGIWGNYSYVINGRKGADKALGILQPITEHSDNMMHAATVEEKVKGYYLQEPIVFFTDKFKSQTSD